ncbi:MAG: hypothetical protein KDN22_33815 [Verrucomicrobiae bacterium]|nr:hypothetical protein [Verrucomicrobiae bacterium]
MFGRKGQILRAFLLALALGIAAGYGTKWLRERPQTLRARGVGVASGVRAPVSTDRMSAEKDPAPPVGVTGTNIFLPPPARSVEELVQLALRWPGDSAVGRLQLESALREATGIQLESWLLQLLVDQKRDADYRGRRALWSISSALLNRWAQTDPLEAIDKIAKWQPKMQAEVMDNLIVALASEARAVADEVFDRLPKEHRSLFLSRYCLFAARQESDADTAKAFLEAHAANDSERAWWAEWIEPNIVKASLPSDIREARAAIGELPKAQQESTWREFYSAVLERFPEPEFALREAVRQGIDDQNPAVRLEFLRRLADGWAASDIHGALDWANQLRGDERAEIVQAIIGRRQRDPRELVEVAERLPESDRSPKMIQSIADQLRSVDPVQAAQWFLDQPESANGKMPRELVSEWASADPEGISQYVAEHPEFLESQKSSEFDAIVTALFQQLGQAAFALADHLEDEKTVSSH